MNLNTWGSADGSTGPTRTPLRTSAEIRLRKQAIAEDIYPDSTPVSKLRVQAIDWHRDQGCVVQVDPDGTINLVDDSAMPTWPNVSGSP